MSKKVYFKALALITVLTAAFAGVIALPASGKGEDLVSGGDFNDGSEYFASNSGTTNGKWWNGTSIAGWENLIVPYDPENAELGNYLYIPAGVGKAVGFSFPMTGGVNYEISVDVCSGGNVNIFFSDGSGDVFRAPSTENKWIRITRHYKCTAAAGENVDNQLIRLANYDAGKAVKFDNLRIYQITGEEAENIFGGGDFEEQIGGYVPYQAFHSSTAISSVTAISGTKSLSFSTADTSAKLPYYIKDAGWYRLSYRTTGGLIQMSGFAGAAWTGLLGQNFGNWQVFGFNSEDSTLTWDQVKNVPWAEFYCVKQHSVSSMISELALLRADTYFKSSLPTYIDDIRIERIDTKPHLALNNKYYKGVTQFFNQPIDSLSEVVTGVTGYAVNPTVTQVVTCDAVSKTAGEPMRLIVAQYKTQGDSVILTDVAVENKTSAAANELVSFSKEVTVADDTEMMKLLIWNGETQQPYREAVTVTR